VIDHNNATGLESQSDYSWDLQDRLINRIHTPNVATLSTYSVDSYVYVDPLLIGNIHTDYSSSGSTEQLLYHAVSPEGVPQTGWSFDRVTLATSEVWRAQYTAFGRRTSLTGTSPSLRPPHLFLGQIELSASDASWWNGSTYFVSREPLFLNMWRVYDPRIGQYLQPDPFVVDGQLALAHGYAYVGLGPLDQSDPDGRACHPNSNVEIARRERRRREEEFRRRGVLPPEDVDTFTCPPEWEVCRGPGCDACCDFQAPANPGRCRALCCSGYR
jgi:RHS repeat-associated protein